GPGHRVMARHRGFSPAGNRRMVFLRGYVECARIPCARGGDGPLTRFRFSLQTVLDVRKRREEGAQLELAQAVVARQEAARAVERVEARLAGALSAWDALAREGMLDPALWLGQAHYAARVRRERDAARQRYRAAEQ